MSLLRPHVYNAFYGTLSKADEALKPLENIGIVGATVDVARDDETNAITESFLMPSEMPFISAGHNILGENGYRLARRPTISVCDLKYKSDFLKGAFAGAHIDFLILSAVYHNPGNPQMSTTQTRQSPLATNPDAWIQAFRDVNAIAILNVSKHGDPKSGQQLSELIDATGLYRQVYQSTGDIVAMCDEEIDTPLLDCSSGTMFIRKDALTL